MVIFCTASLADEKDDLSKHSIYSTYHFGRYASMIYVGIQPIGLPIGVTAEVIKMDRILNVFERQGQINRSQRQEDWLCNRFYCLL